MFQWLRNSYGANNVVEFRCKMFAEEANAWWHNRSNGNLNKSVTLRPANQYEIDSSMNNKVFDTNLILSVFLDFKKWILYW